MVGTVTDPSGSVLPNVTITLTNIDTGIVRTITTNEAGQYVVPGLHIGRYTIQAQTIGFAVAEKTGIVLNVGDRDRVDFELKVGGVQEHITVEANSIAVQTDSGEISSVITGQQITQLETNGRSLYSLINLTPGASSLQMDFQVATPMGGDKSVSFNGQRVAHNLFMVDGAEAADRGGSGAIVMPSLDAIAEFRQLTSNYSAEYGLSSSATITTALKSGTKQLHASGWWFGRNDFVNARNYFTPRQNANGTFNRIPALRFNTWGFNVGGPVDAWKSEHKTFFFYNMEWRRLIQGGTLRTNVPFVSTYGGNLTEAVNFSVANPGNASLFNDSKQPAGGIPTPGSVRTPCESLLSPSQAAKFRAAGTPPSTCAADGTVTTAVSFPGNVIPASLLDPNAQALLAAGIFPAPTSGRTFIGGSNAPTNVAEEIARVDHQFNSKFSIFGHWISEQVSQTDIPTRWSGGANLPTVWDTFGNPSYSAVAHTTYTISPTLLNETAFNYGANRINMLPAGKFQISGTNFQQHKLFPTPSNVIPIINLNNGGKTGSRFDANWNPWVNKADSYQFRDDLSWTKGQHQLKFGMSWLNFRKLQPLQVTTQGNFNFSGTFTNYDFADFLLGFSNQYSEAALKDNRQWNSVSWGAYVQDNWRATSRLTVNLGLRWDGMPHTAEVNGQMSNFYPNLYNPANAPLFTNASATQICSGVDIPIRSGCTAASPALGAGPNPALAGLMFYTNGLGVPGRTPGVTNGLVDNHWNNWGPRLGFAYDLTGGGKTIIRGGLGVMFERIQGNDMYQAGGNNLFGAAPTINNVSLSDPHNFVDKDVSISTTQLPVTVNNITRLNSGRYKNPTSYQYSLGVQQQLGAQTVLSASYVGNQNRFLSDRVESNLPDFAQLPNIITNIKTAPWNSLVPFRGYRSINVEQNEANSQYNALQVELRAKMHDLSLQASYTFSRGEDPATNAGGNDNDLNNVSNPWQGWRYDIGPGIFDRTHTAFVNFIYDLPFFRSSSNRFFKNGLGGWQLSGIVTMQSGAPINLGVSGDNICQTVPNCTVRPDLTGRISYPKSAARLASGNNTMQWFDPTAFTKAILPGTSVATFGNLKKNALRGPGRDNWNLALFKNFVLSETRGSRFELRGEMFNAWNHTQFIGDVLAGGINANVAGTDFGKFTRAYDPRTFQLGAKVVF